MKVNIYMLTHFLSSYKKSLSTFFFVFMTCWLYGQTIVDNSPGSKTWTVPAGVTSVTAEVWGSGGSGGGSSSNGRSGSGAGGGGYSSKTFNVAAGNTINYTVGAGALAGLAGGNGNNGNPSSLTHVPSGTALTGNGGGRGNANSPTGGIGGTGLGGSTNISGSNGGGGNSGTGGDGGDGGNAPGTGGAGQSNVNGLPGTVPGGGGGGGERGTNNRSGGAGANGQVMIKYISVSGVSPNPVCVGSTITITGDNFSTTGTTTVSINGTACTGVTVVNTTTITAVVAAGTTSGVVFVNNPNGTNNGQSITVNPLPTAVTVIGTTPACTSTTLTASNGSNGTIYWQGTTSNGTSTATPSTSQVVSVSGTYYFRARSAAGCWGPQGSITVVINTPPAAIGGGAAAVCVGATTPAFTNSVGGGTWSIINGTGSASITSGGVVTGLTAGNVTVAYTVGSCPAVTQSLTVNPAPSAIGGGASTVCVGSTTPAFTNSVGGGTWSISNGTGSATITSGGVVTGVSAGSATVVYTIGTCSVSVPITVIATPVITTNPSNVSVAAGANTSFTVAASNTPSTYTWQVSTDGGASWATVSNGGVYSNATTATLNITGVTFAMNGYLYRASATNACGVSAYSSNATLTLSYCTPNFNNTDKGRLYINSFQFIGVLNNPPANPSGFASGYQDFTSFTPIAEQPQGTAVNVIAYRGTNGTTNGTWKAWVDWNKDGDFTDSGEEVYNMITFTTSSVTFGFVIPAGQAIGNYRLRIGTFSAGNNNFSSCSTANGYGEMEDYLFKVVTDCPAKVLSVNDVNAFDGERCGPGSVRISATGNASAVSFNWYDSIYGGTLLGTGNTYMTPSISTTTTYYVTAVSSSGCETAFRYPVEARIDPNPTVTFSTSDPAICGEDKPSLLLTASGDKFQDEFFEDFSSGLGVFSNDDSESTLKSTLASWQNKPTPYIPTIAEGYEGLSPAMSSGYFGGNYAMINSDIDRTTAVKYHLVSGNRNVNGFLNLQLDFDLYHFSIAYDNTEGYIEVSYTLDGSVTNPTWVPLVLPGLTTPSTGSPTRYWQNIGNPLKWQHFTVNIPGSNFTATNFRIRFSHFAQGQVTSGSHPQKFYEAITTVDNVRLSGYKIITTPFKWNSAATTVYDTDCVTPLPINDLRSTVCVKPSPTELEALDWTFNASATFSNGCPAIGSFAVANDTKTWIQPSHSDWNLHAQWKPSSIPDINKCVIVRTPVELPSLTTGTHGLARSVIVKSGGKLTIHPKSSLTIQNYIKNEAAAADIVVDNDANLIQVNNAAVNIGNVTVKRSANLKRLDYNYWGAPVTGQNVKTFSPGTLDTRFYVYNESNDYFDGLYVKNLYPDNVTYSLTPTVDKNTYTFIKGKGYAIRASNSLSSTSSAQMHNFVGVPNNGIVDIPLLKSATGFGYNLISNPYPSHIDFYKIYEYSYNGGANKNEDLIYNTAYFWTNTNFNPKMQGSNYPSNVGTTTIINNYAVLNGTGGLGAPYGFNGTGVNTPVSIVPTSIIKPGQGFIVKAKGNGTLRIENGSNIRTNDANAIFFNRMSGSRTAEVTKDRFWLSLKTPLDFVTPLLIGYLKGATNNFEEDYDAELFVHGGDSFYSLLEDKKLGIQGRSPFNVNDKVSLGATFGLQGQYEIFIENKEGIFASQQPIYLKDHLTGVVTNLSQEKYVFTANVGDTTNRFEIQYTNEGTLNTSDLKNKSTVVYQVQNDIIIESPSTIKGVKVYDASGKMVHHSKEKEMKVVISSMKYSSGVYVLEISTEKGVEVRKIVK